MTSQSHQQNQVGLQRSLEISRALTAAKKLSNFSRHIQRPLEISGITILAPEMKEMYCDGTCFADGLGIADETSYTSLGLIQMNNGYLIHHLDQFG